MSTQNLDADARLPLAQALQDKRAADRDKDWQREKARTLRNRDLS